MTMEESRFPLDFGCMTTKRLRKEDRRHQLLDTARTIVREEGTEALTLGYLAEQAGVTKPVAYDHFVDREGLLIALYRAFDDKQMQAMRRSLAVGATTLEKSVRIFSSAYIGCALTEGPETGAIVAALSGSQSLSAFLDECRSAYAACFREALKPFVKLRGGRGEAVLIAILGAAEAVSSAVGLRRISPVAAEVALSAALLGILREYSEKSGGNRDA